MTRIYESLSGTPSSWINHTFIRQLDDITDFSVKTEQEEEKDFFGLLGEYVADNAVPITVICATLVVSCVSIWTIRRHNVSRDYREFKKNLREEKGHLKRPKKINDKTKK